MKIEGEHANVDQQLLFQRLLTVTERYDDVTSQFPYELCPYPAAMFESLLVQPGEPLPKHCVSPRKPWYSLQLNTVPLSGAEAHT